MSVDQYRDSRGGAPTILAALFMFSDRLIYPFYATAPRIAGFTPLGDQIVAGAIMWVPGSIFYLVPAALIVFQMLAPHNLSSPLPVGERIEGRTEFIPSN